MRKVIFTAILSGLIFIAQAQHENTDFTSTGRAGVATTLATDYHAASINPANLGFKPQYETKKVTFGLLESSFSAYTSALTKTNFKKAITNFGGTEFNYQQKLTAANNFVAQPLSLNLDLTPIGIAFQSEKFGGISISTRESFRWYSQFGPQTSQILFLGKTAPYFDSLQLNNGQKIKNTPHNVDSVGLENIARGYSSTPQQLSVLLDGSKIKMHWYREYNISYGREVYNNDVIAITAGIGLKYVQGFQYIDIKAENGKLEGVGAFNPAFNINFGTAAISNPSAINGSNYQSVGKGFGLDLGVDFIYREKTKVGVAITNIGSVKYTGNVYEIKDSTIYSVSSEGFNSYNIFYEAPNMVSNKGLFRYTGKKDLVVKLPTVLRFGASHKLNDKLQFGIDFIAPFNQTAGNFQKPVIAAGADLFPVRWIKLSSGTFLGGNYGSRAVVPFGLTFIVGENGTWEVGAATRDIITYFRQDSPALSLAFGFLRFRI